MIRTLDLFDLRHTLAGALLGRFLHPWQVLPEIREIILALGETLEDGYSLEAPGIWIHNTASIAPSARLEGPCIIGPETQVRHCALLRGCVLLGAGCVVGNSTEVKNSLFLDGAKAPHFNYVGDSILGHHAHLGAGAIVSNVKSDKSPVTVRWGCGSIATGLKKCGAFVGDGAEVGCGSVLNPGTLLGRESSVYPLSSVRGMVPERCILKQGSLIIPKSPENPAREG